VVPGNFFFNKGGWKGRGRKVREEPFWPEGKVPSLIKEGNFQGFFNFNWGKGIIRWEFFPKGFQNWPIQILLNSNIPKNIPSILCYLYYSLQQVARYYILSPY